MPFPFPVGLDQDRDVPHRGVSSNEQGAVAIRFGPKFTPIPRGNFTYSETLKKINWKDIFPDVETIAPYIEKQVRISNENIVIASNIANGSLVPFYWMGAIVYITQASLWFKNEDYRNHVVEAWRLLLADAFSFCILPSLVIAFSVIERWYKLRTAKSSAESSLESLKQVYEAKRDALLETRDSMMEFFSLTERFYQLQQSLTIDDFAKLRRETAKFFEDNKLDSKGLDIKKLTASDLIALVYETMHAEKYNFLVNRIKKAIKSDFMKRQEYISEKLTRELTLRSKGKSGALGYLTEEQITELLAKLNVYSLTHFCNGVDNNKDILTQYFYLIGETSCDKTDPNASMLLNAIDIFEDGLDETLKKSVSAYWNDKSTVKLTHPHGVVLDSMAKVVNSKIIDNHFYRVNESISCATTPRVDPNIFPAISNKAKELFHSQPQLSQVPPSIVCVAPSTSQPLVNSTITPMWQRQYSVGDRHRSHSQPVRANFAVTPRCPPAEYIPQPVAWTSSHR